MTAEKNLSIFKALRKYKKTKKLLTLRLSHFEITKCLP